MVLPMGKQIVEALINGGQASAAPPLGPALGPLGVNIGQIIQEINKKTAGFKGMQVPIKVNVDTEDKSFTISVGTPPSSALIKKEAGIEKGSGSPLVDKVADLKIEQIIKVATMKEDSLSGKDMFAKVKEIIGTCDSMGVLVEGKQAREVIHDIDKGLFKKEIESRKTELSAEELKILEEEKKRLAEEIIKRREEFLAKAKEILAALVGKSKGEIKAKLHEAKIPEVIIKEVMPDEASATVAGAKPGAPAAAGKPSAGAAAEKKAEAPKAEKK